MKKYLVRDILEVLMQESAIFTVCTSEMTLTRLKIARTGRTFFLVDESAPDKTIGILQATGIATYSINSNTIQIQIGNMTLKNFKYSVSLDINISKLHAASQCACGMSEYVENMIECECCDTYYCKECSDDLILHDERYYCEEMEVSAYAN